MELLLSVAIGAAMTLGAPGGERSRVLVAPGWHVRGVNTRITDALAEGRRRSKTFAALVDALDRSDVIAYVETRFELPPSIRGRLLFAHSSAVGVRYVRIQIHALLSSDDLIVVLGHELQHALEIALTPAIRDEPSMRRFYQRAGAGMSDAQGFETAAARIAGDRVQHELRRTS